MTCNIGVANLHARGVQIDMECAPRASGKPGTMVQNTLMALWGEGVVIKVHSRLKP